MGSVSPPSPDYSAAAEKPPRDSAADRELRHVTKFEDRYNMVMPYCPFFRFEMDPTYDPRVDCDTDSEDEESGKKDATPIEKVIEEVIPTLVKYVNQIRESFGFDVDCIAPRWFNGGYYPIEMARAKLENERFYEKKMKIVDFAIAEINADLIYEGKSGIELVKLEKAVLFSPCWMDLLTLVVKTKGKEIGEDDDDGDMNEKTIQAIVYEGHGDEPPLTLEQWRYKPVEPDFWYKAPPPPQIRDDDV